MDCEFCNYFMSIEPQRIVYEDENYISFLARESLATGHCVIMPKDHSEFVADVHDVKRFFTLIRYLSQSIMDAVSADHVRIETRYGGDHKIRHVHVHLVPVFSDSERKKAAESIKNADEKILQNLRNSQWYGTLNTA